MTETIPECRILDERFERAAPETIREWQERGLRELLDTVWKRNEFYRTHWLKNGAEVGMGASLYDLLRRIPLVRKADFLADQEEEPPFGRRARYALQQGCSFVVLTTSGTTGQGVEVHIETLTERNKTYQVSNYGYRWAGLKAGDSIFLNYPITLLGGGRIEIYGLEAYGLTIYPVGNYDVQHKLQLLDRFRPTSLQATTSYLAHLAAASDQNPPAPWMKAVFGGGEGGGFAWFERLSEQWRVPIVNQYGATQTRVDTMYTCERSIGTRDYPGMLHNIDPYFILEVIDPKTGEHVNEGEAGEIVLTSLIHTDVPLVRYAMNDRAVYHDSTYCTCGRPFSGVEIASIQRMDDMVKVKGVNVWPEAVDDVLFSFKEIEEYQVIISSDAEERDTIGVRIMVKRLLSAEMQSELTGAVERALHTRIGIRFNVEVVPAGTLAYSEYKARRWNDKRARYVNI